jgi:EF-P beta-lysylation protein EpmB
MRETYSTWQKILAQGFSSSSELLQFLELPIDAMCNKAEITFKTRVPKGFVALMQPGNINDPLLLQVLAQPREMVEASEYEKDPLQEGKKNPIKGLIHKYHGRVLLTITGACAIHCRYCFRRHFPYQKNNPGQNGWADVLEYLEKDNHIHEVILSGGDPLIANDLVLSNLIESLEKIPHVKTLRIHTRIPIVLPERIDESFLTLMRSTRFNKVMVLHCNHPREIDERVALACKQLKNIGFHLLNQSVLLKDVNDSLDVLTALSHKLLSSEIMPYYLHVLDKVAGATHFDVPLEKAKFLHAQLQTKLPGYLVPKLAKEEPGKAHKTLI